MANWEERYKEGAGAADEPHPLVVRYASKLQPGTALDLASGAGRHAIWLAERGWHVTAVDNAPSANEILQRRASEKVAVVNSYIADLEAGEFVIEPEAYDLIIDCMYLQRDLFPSIRSGARPGAVVIAIIAMVDDDPQVKPMNSAFLLNPGELRSQFDGWDLLHDFEGKPAGDPHRRNMAEIVARRR
jgi:tellurite methyltransferase